MTQGAWDAIGLVLAAVVTGLFALLGVVLTANVKRGVDHLGELRHELAAMARALGGHLRDHDAHSWMRGGGRKD